MLACCAPKNESSKVPSTAVNIFLAEKISKQYEEAQHKVRFVISMPHNPFINCFSGNIDELLGLTANELSLQFNWRDNSYWQWLLPISFQLLVISYLPCRWLHFDSWVLIHVSSDILS